MNINIITFHDTANYGATLQCCALFRYMEKCGNNVTVINYLPYYVSEKKRIFKRIDLSTGIKRAIKTILRNIKYLRYVPELCRRKNRYRDFISSNINLTREYNNIDQLSDFPPVADLYICGSDQIWNSKLTGGKLDDAFFLKFTDGEKAAYGVSLGEMDVEAFRSELNKMTKGFKALSVREKSSSVQLESILGRKVDVVLDCTLLLEQTDYAAMENESYEINGPYLLLYDIQHSLISIAIAKREAERRNLRIINISPKPLNRVDKAQNILDIGPAEFLMLFKKASYVVTNSFHGTSFSIIYEKQFITTPTTVRSNRMVELLDALNLMDRMAFDNNYEPSSEIDYIVVKPRLRVLQEHSYDYIKKILE